MRNSAEFHVALGGNLPFGGASPAQTLPRAIAAMSAFDLKVLAQSSLYNTPCFPAGAGPDYVNAAVTVSSSKSPAEVLAALHKIEAQFSRERLSRWGQRTLDLDLLSAGDAVLPDLETFHRWQTLPLEIQKKQAPDQLILPHPRLAERAFVLVPLAEIAPGWVHPVSGLSVAEMCAALPEAARAEVKRL